MMKAAFAVALVLGHPAVAMAEAAPPAPAAVPPAAAPAPSAYRRGVEAVHAGRLDEAEAAARRLLDQPAQADAGRRLLGLVRARRGDLAGALAEFDKALALEPQSTEGRAERAVVQARLGHLDKARADLDVLRARAAACGRACPPELKVATSRVEAALAAARPPPAAAAESP